MSRKSKRPRKHNTTGWPTPFLRRMVSWVCRELEYPVRNLTGWYFRNKTKGAYSGRAHCHNTTRQRIVVSIGPETSYPTKDRTHRGVWSAGVLADRIEGLVFVTAHEIAHCDNVRRRNTSRRYAEAAGNYGGSEEYTDRRAKAVLDVFREQRELLLSKWGPLAVEAESTKTESTVVARRAAKAFQKEAEWEKKLKAAEAGLRKWKRKADYYRKKYPDGAYPTTREKPKSRTLKPEVELRRKINRYITLAVADAGISHNKLRVYVFGAEGSLTRPYQNYEWEGDFYSMLEARKKACLGDRLEVNSYTRFDDALIDCDEIEIPPTVELLDYCLRESLPYYRISKSAVAKKE